MVQSILLGSREAMFFPEKLLRHEAAAQPTSKNRERATIQAVIGNRSSCCDRKSSLQHIFPPVKFTKDRSPTTSNISLGQLWREFIPLSLSDVRMAADNHAGAFTRRMEQLSRSRDCANFGDRVATLFPRIVNLSW